MKLIIAGGRDFNDADLMGARFLGLIFYTEVTEVTEIVDGYCKTGADALARELAATLNIPNKHFPADWLRLGRSAGPIRNKEMAEYVGKEGHLLAFHDGKSPGTKNMIENARKVGMKVTIVKYDPPPPKPPYKVKGVDMRKKDPNNR